MDALPDIRNQRSQEIARQHQPAAPAAPAHDVEREITRILHFRGTRDRRAERSNNGHEAGEDHRLAAIFLIKRVRSLQMAPLEETGILAMVERPPRTPP